MRNWGDSFRVPLKQYFVHMACAEGLKSRAVLKSGVVVNPVVFFYPPWRLALSPSVFQSTGRDIAMIIFVTFDPPESLSGWSSS